MKNLSLVLNIILLAAVAFLFYKQFSGGSASSSVGSVAPGQERLAYVNIDSLYAHYAFYTESKSELEQKMRTASVDLEDRTRNFLKKQENYSKMAQAGLLSANQIKDRESELMREGQQLEQYKMSAEQGLAVLEQEKVESLYKRINEYLKRYNQDQKYTFIFGYKPGDMLWYTNSAADITKEVVAAMNKEYEEEKAKGAATSEK